MSGQGQEVCLHYLNGLCRFGTDCSKAHDPSELRPLCTFFERGSCNRGASCLYAHGPDDRQPRLAPERPSGGRGGGRGRGRQGGAPRPRPPPAPEHPLQVYRDATEEELDMLEEWEEEEERRQAVAAYQRLQRRQQGEGTASDGAAGAGAAGAKEGVKGKAAPPAAGEGGEADGTDGSSGDSEAEAAGGGSGPAASRQPGAAQQEIPAICSQQYGKVVTPTFLATNWCAPCRRSFTTPDGLLSHLKAAHKQDSERIAALEALRCCPCGLEFEAFTPLSKHIREVHCKATPAQREGAAIGDALFRMAMLGGFGGGYGSSDEDDYGGYGGFSGADVEDLLCQGVKPWDDDAADVLAVLNGDFDYY